MFSKIVIALIYLSLSNFVLANNSKFPLCDLINSGNVTYQTNSPTNVNTKNVNFVRGPPLVIQNALFAPLVVKNNGHNLEVLGNPVAPDSGATYSGVLCNQLYIFHKVDFYSNPKSGRSYNTIDGKGTPLTARLIYFNAKYGSFGKSLEYRDGLVAEDFLIDFSPVDNPLFYPVQFVIFFILRKAGAQIALPASLIYAWFDRLPVIHEYYAFLGSYRDHKTGVQYPCVINILAKKVIYTLSKWQFLSSFASLLDMEGKIQDSTQSLYPPGGRTFYEGQELAQVLTPF